MFTREQIVAEYLNYSVTYLRKILANGLLPSLDSADVEAFKIKRDRDRRQALDEMSAVRQRFGLYD